MSAITPNLNLVKPDYTQDADVDAMNDNMDKIDDYAASCNQAIGDLANLTTTEKGSLVGAANELNSKITNIGKIASGKKNTGSVASQTTAEITVDISSLGFTAITAIQLTVSAVSGAFKDLRVVSYTPYSFKFSIVNNYTTALSWDVFYTIHGT